MLKATEKYRLVLLKAADIIKSKGYCKFKLHNHQGNVCAMGAINMALTGIPTYCTMYQDKEIIDTLEDVTDALHCYLKLKDEYTTEWKNIRAIADWNDNVATRKEDVINGLIGAALAPIPGAINTKHTIGDM